MKPKTPKYTPLTLNIKDYPYMSDVNGMRDFFMLEISLNILEAIKYCLYKGMNELVYYIEIDSNFNKQYFNVSTDNFISKLNTILPELEKFEKYEQCQEIIELKQKIANSKTDLEIKKGLQQAVLSL